MELIASADVAAVNLLDYSVTPACLPEAVGEAIVRIPRCQVLAVANLSNVQPPSYPFPQVPSAPREYSPGAHAFVGLRDGATGSWEYFAARGESDDCRAVSFRAYVRQGWTGVNGLVFRTGSVFPTYAKLELEAVRIVFDAISGLIFYTVAISRAGEAGDDDTDPDEYAMTAAKALAPEGLHLRVRSLDRPLPAGRSFRVDPDSGSVIEVRQRKGD